jgi:YidC/Oxa1 family membrane protein insertase
MALTHALGALLRHWSDYRRFRRTSRESRRIVVYSESAQDWHHFQPVLRYLTGTLGLTLCYVSSEERDPGLHQHDPRLLPFCIGKGVVRIWFFQFLEADVLLTQMLDLGNLELKRSVHPVHYVYMFHSLISTHMADREDSFDHYDTILCAGPHQAREIRRREELAGLPPKRLVPHGYHRIEQLMAERRAPPSVHTDGDIHVLLAPSWGERTILNVCGLELTEVLLAAGFRVTLRPHFQTRWQTPEVIDRITCRYGAHPRFALVEEMGESDSLFDSHVMITDWSGAAHDYALGLGKPVLFIDLPPKSRNDAWPRLGIEPFEMQVRAKLGALLPPERVAEAPQAIRALIGAPDRFRDAIEALRRECVYNLGHSASAAAEAIAALAAGLTRDRATRPAPGGK